VDVRTEEELSGELGKLDGIIHIPLQELATRHGELAGFRDRNIYVICRSGNRSGTAAELLRSKGYRAINVEGGMRAWRKAYGVQNN
jgi:rhodanese-related sulfurtransferase